MYFWNTAWFNKMDPILYIYISWNIHGMLMIYVTFERGGPKFSNTTARALTYHTAVQQRQLRAKWLLCSTRFAFVSSLKLSWWLLCSVRFVFVSTFNIQQGRTFDIGITNLSKRAVCVKAKALADHVDQRRTWDKFKSVLSIAHASQPIEWVENLEYHNQLSGVCWDAIYSSIWHFPGVIEEYHKSQNIAYKSPAGTFSFMNININYLITLLLTLM